jgi:hypothetical protein
LNLFVRPFFFSSSSVQKEKNVQCRSSGKNQNTTKQYERIEFFLKRTRDIKFSRFVRTRICPLSIVHLSLSLTQHNIYRFSIGEKGQRDISASLNHVQSFLFIYLILLTCFFLLFPLVWRRGLYRHWVLEYG